MTIPSIADVAVVTTSTTTDQVSYVDWPAIIAGIILASAISLVLLTFGSAIGLGFTNFDAKPDASPIWIAIAAASWLLWVQISSFMAGAYLTGRLRKRHHDGTPDEVDVRDGAHGLLVWGGALVVGAVIAVSGIGAAASAVGSAAATLTTAASNVAGDAAEALDPNAYYVDTLFRAAPAADAVDPAADTAAAPAATTAAPTTTAPATMVATAPEAAPDTSAARAEAGRIFAQSAMSGEVSADDRTYLAQSIAANTGLTTEEATARVDQTMAAMDAAKAKAAEAAEAARKAAVLAAFLTAASLLVSAAGAFWAAQKGGNHRDENTVFAGAFRRI